MDIPWWVFIVAWVLLASLSPKKKRPPVAGGQPEPPVDGELGELGRALRQLAQAEEQALKKQQAPEPSGEAPVAEARRPAPQRRPPPPSSRKTVKREVFYPKPQRAPRKKPIVAALEDDDADKSSEDPLVVSMEGQDYDSEAERIIAARHRAAEREVREDRSVEALSAEQAARRTAGPEGRPIGGAAEHAEWHKRLAAEAVPRDAAAARPGRLSRFATGRLKDAVILREVLGRPVGQR
jgi:hypothetical protein